MLLRKLGPVGISAVLWSVFLVIAAVGVTASRSGGGDLVTRATQSSPLAPPGTASSGAILQRPGGGQAETFFSLVGSEFRIVGRLASVDSNQLLVKGPEKYVRLNIAEDAKIEGTLAGGQIVKASGNFDDNGDAQATEVQPACSAAAAVAAITAAPTPFPFPAEPTATPVPAPAVVRKSKPGIAAPANGDDPPAPTPKPRGDAKPARAADDRHDKHNENDKDE